jgi:phosphoglycolate phosphatase-like HAD superfamily hydrolase
MSVVFDLDGTLADTRKAVEMSYSYFGVRMPKDAWGKPWQEWLPDAAGSFKDACLIHVAKNEIYPKMINRYARRLPPADLAFKLFENNIPIQVLTGASEDATISVLNFLQLTGMIKVLGTGMTFEQKNKKIYAAWMSSCIAWNGRQEPMIYIDDDLNMVNHVNSRGRKDLFAFHYTDENFPNILKKVHETWTL